MEESKYVIENVIGSNSYSIKLDNKVEASGLLNIRSALKAIWVLSGNDESKYYHHIDGKVMIEGKKR